LVANLYGIAGPDPPALVRGQARSYGTPAGLELRVDQDLRPSAWSRYGPL